MEIDNSKVEVSIAKRPGLSDLLEQAHQNYEIIIYTASLPGYANPIIQQIDPSNFIDYKLYREHCTIAGSGFIKDLSLLGRNLKDVIIVDNTPLSFCLQPGNGISITTWMGDLRDHQLLFLASLLEGLVEVNDVRPWLQKVNSRGCLADYDAITCIKAEIKYQNSKFMENYIKNGRSKKNNGVKKKQRTLEPIISKFNSN